MNPEDVGAPEAKGRREDEEWYSDDDKRLEETREIVQHVEEKQVEHAREATCVWSQASVPSSSFPPLDFQSFGFLGSSVWISILGLGIDRSMEGFFCKA
jgi:hypothetical protein